MLTIRPRFETTTLKIADTVDEDGELEINIINSVRPYRAFIYLTERHVKQLIDHFHKIFPTNRNLMRRCLNEIEREKSLVKLGSSLDAHQHYATLNTLCIDLKDHLEQ